MKMIYNPLIDGLRAVAVISVILFHLELILFDYVLFQGGFVGVDIFFVISGYLIARIFIIETNDKIYSTKNFLIKRLRRLAPLLLTVLLVSLIAGYLIQFPNEFYELSNDVFSSSLFVSNFDFYLEDNYFAIENSRKPLLHTWSLSLEAQIYLLFLLLFILFNKNLLSNYSFFTLFFILLISLLIGHLIKMSPEIKFYLIQSRMWEFLAGSLLSIYKFKYKFSKIEKFTNSAAWQTVGISLIVLPILIFNEFTPHPSLFTAIPVIGTLMILSINHKDLLFPVKFLINRKIIFVGMISYSLYLWHYPAIVFSRIFSINELDNLEKIIIILVIFYLSFISWKFVEIPFRNKKIVNDVNFLFIFSLVLSFILLFCYLITSTNGVPKRFTSQELSLINYEPARGAFDFECRRTKIDNPCIVGEKKGEEKLVLLGDSHAENLSSELDRLLEKKGFSARLLYKAGCPFIFNLERIHKFLDCSKHNQDVFDILIESNVSKVIISDRGGNYINGMPFDNYEGGVEFKMTKNKPSKLAFDVYFEDNNRDFGTKTNKQRVIDATERFEFTMKKLLDKNINIIYISPIPSVGGDAPRIIHKKLMRKELPFSTNLNAYLDYHRDFFETLKKLDEMYDGFNLVFPHKVFCSENSNRCSVHLDDKILYTDNDHLSKDGVKILFKEIEKYIAY